jgi:hypothetical protein
MEQNQLALGIFAVNVERPPDIGIVEQVGELAVTAIFSSDFHRSSTSG